MTPLAPAILLAVPSFLLYFWRGRLPHRVAHVLSLAGPAAVLLVVLGLRFGFPEVGVQEAPQLSWDWDPSAAPNEQPHFATEPISLAFVFALGFVSLAALGSRSATDESSLWTDLLILAATTIFLTATEGVALVLAWFILDASLFLAAATWLGFEAAVRLAGINLLGGAAWILFTSISTQTPGDPALLAGLAGIALWVRSGLYPAHGWARVSEELPVWRRVLWGGANLSAAGYLWSLAISPAWGLAWLGLLVSLRGALDLWKGPSSMKFVQVQVSLGATLAWAGPAISGEVIALYFISLMAASAILYLSRALLAGGGWAPLLATSIPTAIAVASLMGAPPTLGFAARWLLYAGLTNASPLILTMALLIYLLSLPPLIVALREKRPLGIPSEVGGLIWLWYLALPLATLSLIPSVLVSWGYPAGELWDSALAGGAKGYSLWAMLLVPAVGAGLLFLRGSELASFVEDLEQRIAPSFRGAYTIWFLGAIGQAAGEILEAAAWLGRGRHGAIWLTLYALGIVLLVFLM